MTDTKINLRLKNILKKLCSQNDYVTVIAIAKDLGVSSRTILRELPSVENWLQKKGFSLDKKTGVGIKANGSLEDRNKIINILLDEKEEKIYTPKERLNIITSELLQSHEPVKLYNFIKVLNVTEATISNDLDKVEEWLKKHLLTLKRKQGVGVYIEGDEDNIRKCMINLIYENFNENYLLRLIQNNITEDLVPVSNTELIARSRLLKLVNNNTIHELEVLIHNAEEYMGYRFADSAYIGLIVHMAIAIQRIRKNEDIIMDKDFMNELRLTKEYSVAEKLAKEVAKLFDINIPEDEIGYITMHIKGSKNIVTGTNDNNSKIENSELIRLSKEIITIAENETGKFLSQNEKLMIGLVNHLGPALSRLRMNLEIRNPLLMEIKTHYPELLKVAGKCAAAIEKYIGVKIPEPEIAYIAMHLGAAIEKSDTIGKRKFGVAIACATGIGTSMLLATRIEKEYDNIYIIDVISALHVEQSELSEKGIEFIISTVEIEECPVPVVIVNPLLFEADKLKIARLINLLKDTASYQAIKKIRTINLKDKVQILNDYGTAITELLDNFFLKEDSEAESISDLITETSKFITNKESDIEKLKSDLKEREEKGSTFITDYGLLLLHCRTEVVDKLYFGAIKVEKDIICKNARGEDEKVELGIVILAPEDCNKYFIETISHVNGMLIENPNFIRLLKNGTPEEALEELNNILEGYYKLKLNN